MRPNSISEDLGYNGQSEERIRLVVGKSDTHPEIERLRNDLLRQMTPARKMEIMNDLYWFMRGAALAGLRRQYPSASEAELQRRLADRLLGPELAEKAYGPLEAEVAMAQEVFDLVVQVAHLLEKLRVPHFVGGSVASITYGQVRTTLDADLVARLEPPHVEPLVEHLRPDFYVDADMIRDAIAHHASFNLIHLATTFKIDVFIPADDLFTEQQFARVTRQALGADPAEAVNLASPEDVILAKLQWFRAGNEVSTRQWEDVVGVMTIQGDRLDRAYLRQWAQRLGVADLLERALS